MKCPACGHNIALPQARATKVEHFLEVLERNKHNRTHTAKEMGVCIRTIHLWLRALSLDKRRVPNDRGYSGQCWTPEEEKLMIDLCRQGKNYREIGDILGRTPEAVSIKRCRNLKRKRGMRKCQNAATQAKSP
jgi:hypothetical protein